GGWFHPDQPHLPPERSAFPLSLFSKNALSMRLQRRGVFLHFSSWGPHAGNPHTKVPTQSEGIQNIYGCLSPTFPELFQKIPP
ncbi:hypothetical protein GOODEAATRI_024569, partial [Goodea atripinnis]